MGGTKRSGGECGAPKSHKQIINKRALKFVEEDQNKKLRRYSCVCCGEIKTSREFYKTQGSLIWNTEDKVALVCKDCLQKIYTHYKEQYSERVALITICHILDIPYVPHLYEASLLTLKDDEEFNFSQYILKWQSSNWKKDAYKAFADSVANGEIVFAAKNGAIDTGEGLDEPLDPATIVTSASKMQNKIEPMAPVDGAKYSLAWTKDEARNKEFVLSVVGYDPFNNLNLNVQELKFCYNVMAGYCDTDGIQGDSHKLQQAIELSLTQLHSRKVNELIQKEISKPSVNEALLKSLSETKNNFQRMIAKIADDNKFSSAYNESAKPGKFTFTGKMKELSENDFEAIKVNLYDSKTSKAMKQIADLSNRAILDQLSLDANDYAEMVKEQREMIVRLQKDRDYFEEKARVLNNRVEDLISRGAGKKKGGGQS